MTFIRMMVMPGYLPLLNNLRVISVSRFHHVQDRRKRVGRISHLLQSGESAFRRNVNSKCECFHLHSSACLFLSFNYILPIRFFYRFSYIPNKCKLDFTFDFLWNVVFGIQTCTSAAQGYLCIRPVSSTSSRRMTKSTYKPLWST